MHSNIDRRISNMATLEYPFPQLVTSYNVNDPAKCLCNTEWNFSRNSNVSPNSYNPEVGQCNPAGTHILDPQQRADHHTKWCYSGNIYGLL